MADIDGREPGTGSGPDEPTGILQRLSRRPSLMRWLAIFAVFLVVLIVCLAAWGPNMDFPSEIPRDNDGVSEATEISRVISDEIKKGTTWLVRNWGSMFDGIDKAITYTMVNLEDGLRWIPWPATFLTLAAFAAAMAGWRLALFALLSLVFIGLMNRWDSSVETIAIILFSVAVSVVIALPLGVMGARSDRADAAMRPILDGMQTMPSYVYLVPGILFFGLGYTPAVIATVIYAVPPAIRLTNLGIRQVSPAAVEAARSFGASPTQILTKVQVPMAPAYHHGRYQPDNDAGPVHGGHRLAGGRQRVGRGCIPCPATSGSGQQRHCRTVHRPYRHRVRPSDPGGGPQSAGGPAGRPLAV